MVNKVCCTCHLVETVTLSSWTRKVLSTTYSGTQTQRNSVSSMAVSTTTKLNLDIYSYLNDGNTTQHQCQVIIKDPEKNSGSSWDLNPGPSDY